MTQTLKSKPAFVRVSKYDTHGLKQELSEGWVPSQTLPSTSLLSCCAVGKEKLSPCPPARLLPGSQPGAGHQLRTRFVHTLVSPGLGYTETHTSDAFSFLPGSREAARAGGASQGIPSSECCSPQHSPQHKHCGNAS